MKRFRLGALALFAIIAMSCLARNSAAVDRKQANLLVDGRFGQALRSGVSQVAWLEAPANAAFHRPPLTVELWTRLGGKDGHNILLANEVKRSGTHWELYTGAGSGNLCLYAPGLVPSDIQSGPNLADGQWHYLAMVMDEHEVCLYVDARQVARMPVKRNDKLKSTPGPLAIGSLVHAQSGFGCDAAIDEVRISASARQITAIPSAPLVADAQTLALWRFDALSDDAQFPNASPTGNPVKATLLAGRSMDDVDMESYRPGPSPLESPVREIRLQANPVRHPAAPLTFSLDGQWQMAEGGSQAERLAGAWSDAIPANVPGSVHAALVKAGRMPDPTIGQNQKIVRRASDKTWWLRREFTSPRDTAGERLVFDGVCSACEIWLNGELLGRHKGMFGGPEYGVGNLLRGRNTLIVKLDPAEDWRNDVVFNNVYGWHYCNIPARGIWRPVRIEAAPAVRLVHPFIATSDAKAGVMDLAVTLSGQPQGWSGKLAGTIEPENFKGRAFHFEQTVEATTASQALHLRFAIPEPRLWWPVDLGEHNLYKLTLSFQPAEGAVADRKEIGFGIRTIRMAPLPAGPRRDKYNWTFVINGRPTFVKGNGWCTMDPLMDFSRARYDRFLSLAASQHVQMLRGWGSGMPETDEFYDLCNRKGIMVMQEWPTAWNSHEDQPFEALEETVRRNTLRLRNNPSLAMVGGGNESDDPFGPAINMMGRLSHELDGTRPFHRGEPWGGSLHNYNCYWGLQPLDHNVTMTADFWGEFGLASMPCLESVMRYLPDNEKKLWPAPPDGSLTHHTPIFNKAEDWKRLSQYSAYFMPSDSLEHFIVGSQLSQATGVRHTLELARSRWPESTGALYYKMNDNFPAASWSCADWYGVPKIGHYIFQDSFAPLLACAIFKSLNTQGKALELPIVLLDDTDALKGAEWDVVVRAYGPDLKEIKRQSFKGHGSIDRVRRLGKFTMNASQNSATPLLTVTEVRKAGELAQRTFYWTNYEAKKGCLMELPRTRLSLKAERNALIVKNEGSRPAVGVHFVCPKISDRFLADDGYFWLEPGETRRVGANITQGVDVAAWNTTQ